MNPAMSSLLCSIDHAIASAAFKFSAPGPSPPILNSSKSSGKGKASLPWFSNSTAPWKSVIISQLGFSVFKLLVRY